MARQSHCVEVPAPKTRVFFFFLIPDQTEAILSHTGSNLLNVVFDPSKLNANDCCPLAGLVLRADDCTFGNVWTVLVEFPSH